MSIKAAVFFLICCLITAIIIYFPTGLYFLNDDLIHIPLSAKGELFQRNSLRPVHDILLQIDIFLWKKNAAGFHLTALLLHLLSALILYKVSYLLFIEYKKREKKHALIAALITTAIFLIYPFHSEAILWILGRTASLCTLFFLLSLYCYLKKKASVIYFIFSLVFFFIGLFTYEAIWIAPFCIFGLYFLDVFIRKYSWKKEIIWPSFYMLSFFISLIIRYKILGEFAGSYEAGNKTNENIFVDLFLNYNRLLARSFLPPMKSTIFFIACYCIVLIVAMFFLMQILKKQFYLELMFVFFFLISFIPYIFLGINTHSTESERYLYMPSVFLCSLFGFVIYRLQKSKAIIACFIAFIYCTIFLYSNSRNYRIASEISSQVYKETAQKAAVGSKISIDNLPAEFNGIPIFRLGFKEGLNWLYNTDTSKINFSPVEIFSGPNYLIHFMQFNYSFYLLQKNSGNSPNYQLKFQYDTLNFRQGVLVNYELEK